MKKAVILYVVLDFICIFPTAFPNAGTVISIRPPGQRGVPTQYVDALLRELARFAPDAPLHPDTIYFGGGTPSLLSPADAARLIAAAAPAPGAEITLEANPETVTEQTLCGFREAGVEPPSPSG